MRIGLDYDGTYTRDRALWDELIFSARDRGHEVLIVTMRAEAEGVMAVTGAEPPCEVIYTDRKGKVGHMASIGRPIDIWIDDDPRLLMLGTD